MRNKWMPMVGVVSLLALFGGGCGVQNEETEPMETPESVPVEQEETPEVGEGSFPEAIITLEDGRVIRLELYPSIAPNTVNNFIELAEAGFYDGTIFHRIMEDFMIQGGDPTGTGTGGPGYRIKGEFSLNDHDNTLSHLPGVISMARSQPFDTAGSQFFIVHGDASFLDGSYAAFGKVLEGMDVVDALAKVETGPQDRPTNPPVMWTISIERNGYQGAEVEKIQ